MTAALAACADWNLERGLSLLRQSNHEKNNLKYARMCADAGRHLRTYDRLQRQIWLLERARKHNRD